MNTKTLLLTIELPLAVLLMALPVEGQAPKPPQTSTTTPAPIRRMPDGKPNIEGFYTTAAMTGSWGLEDHPAEFGLPGGKALIVDPPDQKLPYLPWAKAEQLRRRQSENGHEDPTAHCFVGGVPRQMYVLGGGIQILQPPGYVVMFFERMAYRVIPLDSRPHLPDSIRLWEGDAVGHWEGDTLVIDTTNFNGKSGLTEIGDFVTQTEHVVERLTPVDAGTVRYQATIEDPMAYSRPWTIAFSYKRGQDELLEVACHEGNQDLEHMLALKKAQDAGTKK
jgi:hypothetical protein